MKDIREKEQEICTYLADLYPRVEIECIFLLEIYSPLAKDALTYIYQNRLYQ